MKSFFNRHQFVLFILLTFMFSWFPWYAGIGPVVMAMGPSIAAFIIVLLVGGKQGLEKRSKK